MKPVYRPLGSTANKTGRIAGDALTGGGLFYRGNLGTGIFKLFDLTIASTGLSEREALAEGSELEICAGTAIKRDSLVLGLDGALPMASSGNTGCGCDSTIAVAANAS